MWQKGVGEDGAQENAGPVRGKGIAGWKDTEWRGGLAVPSRQFCARWYILYGVSFGINVVLRYLEPRRSQ